MITGDTADAARAMANKVADMKPDLLKIRVDDNLGTSRKMPEPAWRAAIEEAHARKLPIAVHIYWLADAKATLLAGADMIAHSVRDVPVDDQFINALKSRDVCYSPTFTREISTFIYDATPSWVDDPFFLKGAEKGVPEQLKDPKRQEQIRNSDGWKAGQQYKAGLEVAKTQPEDAGRSRRAHRVGHRHRPAGTVPGILRAPRARDDGRCRPDADAGARVGDRRRRAVPPQGRRNRHARRRARRPIC